MNGSYCITGTSKGMLLSQPILPIGSDFIGLVVASALGPVILLVSSSLSLETVVTLTFQLGLQLGLL